MNLFVEKEVLLYRASAAGEAEGGEPEAPSRGEVFQGLEEGPESRHGT